jgi:hypothetical protein
MSSITNSNQGITFSSKSKITKLKWWVWLILIAIIFLAIIFMVKRCSSDNIVIPPTIETVIPPTTEVDETPTTPTAATETMTSDTPATALPQGTLEEKAKSVIRGDFGNGAERKRALGSEYDVIQKRVNEKIYAGDIY